MAIISIDQKLVIDVCGPYLYQYRDKIYSEDVDESSSFFIENDYDRENDDNLLNRLYKKFIVYKDIPFLILFIIFCLIVCHSPSLLFNPDNIFVDIYSLV